MAALFHKAARGTQHTRRREGMKKMKGSGEMRARRGGWEEGKFRGGLAPVPIHPALGTSPGSELSRASVKRKHHHFQGLVLLMSQRESPIAWH